MNVVTYGGMDDTNVSTRGGAKRGHRIDNPYYNQSVESRPGTEIKGIGTNSIGLYLYEDVIYNIKPSNIDNNAELCDLSE
ncbi:hypothetical protein DGG96_11915 [Legionella qingyii]|uniref:Uncharacterized protein n=1 Tax=Legionella qingyii TaxID=2184757 RepID=A0A317U2J2_9GAMM|nr:hypothetical protein DGG96_11915 [Legionella qingyii]